MTRVLSKVGSSLFAVILMQAASAEAQVVSTRIFDTTIPITYDRGRNESVVDRPRPAWAPIGFRLGGVVLNPFLDVSLGYDDNVYQTENDEKGDGLLTVAPRLVLTSDWSRHALNLDAGGTFVRYFDESPRDEDGWTVGGTGRLDIGRGSITAGARTSHIYESQLTGASVPDARSSIPVQASIFKILGDMKFARFRTVATVDHSIYDYQTVQLLNGTFYDQADRDRKITRAIGQVEYGITPDAGVFVRAGYTDTDYRNIQQVGAINRDSHEWRFLSGLTMDVTALLRGSVGVGYVKRRYLAPGLPDVKGFSLDAKLEYFPTDLTTVTLTGRRQVEDSILGGSSGYFNNGVAMRIDHELLRNLIVNAGVDYEHDDYKGIDGSATILRMSGGGQYQANRLIWFNGNLAYGRRTSDNALNGPRLDEFRMTFGVSIHP